MKPTPAMHGFSKAPPVQSLIVAPQWIGDAVMCEPLLARLAARGEVLTVAALPWVAPVFRAMPQVGTVVEWPFAHGRLDWALRRRIAADLRGRFERAYVLPNSLKSALVPWLARIPSRIGYAGEGRRGLLNRRLPNPSHGDGARPPMVAFYAALAGIESPAKPCDTASAVGSGERATDPLHRRPRWAVDATTLAAALKLAAVQPQRYWVLVPGAEYGPAKRWPATHFAALAQTLHERHRQPVLLLGSKAEVMLCAEVAALASGHAAPGPSELPHRLAVGQLVAAPTDPFRVLAGQTSLLEAIALIAGARGVVSNDSGLMHVAAAFGVPQAAVFGSTSPAHTPPLSARARVVWLKDELQLDCAPCFERTCRYGHTRCLVDVPAGRVDAALADALEDSV